MDGNDGLECVGKLPSDVATEACCKVATGRSDGLEDRTFHHLTISAGLSSVRGAPELFVRVPVQGDEEASAELVAAVGLRMRFEGANAGGT